MGPGLWIALLNPELRFERVALPRGADELLDLLEVLHARGLLHAAGNVLDDVIIYRRSADKFMVVVNAVNDAKILLNAANGEVLRAIPSGNGGFELDTTFNCRPGVGNAAGPLVDILSLPITNIYGATLLGIDAVGNLLYCKPGDVPQTGLLTAPDTNWGRITGFVLDGGNLYVLDAPSRAVWVYVGKEAAFVDRPYFFFGQQTPTQDVIDFLVYGDEMYLLHADGRVSNCSYSRIDTNASKCQDPLNRINPFRLT